MKPRSKDDWIVMLDAIEAMLKFLREADADEIKRAISLLQGPITEQDRLSRTGSCEASPRVPNVIGNSVGSSQHGVHAKGEQVAGTPSSLQGPAVAGLPPQVDLDPEAMRILRKNRRALYIKSESIPQSVPLTPALREAMKRSTCNDPIEACRMLCAWKGGGPCLAENCPRKTISIFNRCYGLKHETHPKLHVECAGCVDCLPVKRDTCCWCDNGTGDPDETNHCRKCGGLYI